MTRRVSQLRPQERFALEGGGFLTDVSRGVSRPVRFGGLCPSYESAHASFPLGIAMTTALARSSNARPAAPEGRTFALVDNGRGHALARRTWTPVIRAFVTLVGCMSLSHLTHADEPTADQIRHFETSVRPVLVERCLKCHGPDKQWGSLRVDSQAALLKGGDTGPALVPGQPDQSLLIRAIRHVDAELKMPPPPKEEKLSDRQIADFTVWIKQGAAYPDTKPTTAARSRDPNHWAFQSPAASVAPAVKNTAWPQSDMDRFVLARLESAELNPTPAADKRTLLRRATFDLTGLPPTADEIAEFLADDRADAFARQIDRLLA